MSYPPPSYQGTGEASARLTANNTRPDLTYNNKVEVRYLASGGSTRGQFGLYRWTFGPTHSGPESRKSSCRWRQQVPLPRTSPDGRSPRKCPR